MTRQRVLDFIENKERFNNTVFLDKFDSAIIGCSYNKNGIAVIIYDRYKMLDCLMAQENMSETEAEDFIEHDIESKDYGDLTPIIVELIKS